MTSRPLVLMLVLLAVTGGAPRAQNCDQPSSVPEMTECATLRLRAAERELGELYGRLLDSEDREFAAAVREAQEAWMKWREAEGKLAGKTVSDPGLAAHARKTQEALMTEDRVRDLRGYAGN